MSIELVIFSLLGILLLGLVVFLYTFKETVIAHLNEHHNKQQTILHQLQTLLTEKLSHTQQQLDEQQLKNLKILQETLLNTMQQIRESVIVTLKHNAEQTNHQVLQLTNTVDERLKFISGQVEKRLNEGFEKTTATFSDILKRLALIDEAQKKITDLSQNVVSLQEILADKQSRGAFGEIQLAGLIRNMLPEQHFKLQHTLSNGKRADCILFLPEPTGNVVIDAKFPLETFRKLMSTDPSHPERHALAQQFKSDIRKHIQDIASRYIIPGETADGAVMFIPAEAIFAEIHRAYPEVIEQAHQSRVWLVSPTTMMAILTTARAVLKDAATRKQVHIIQEHLSALAKDFSRFEKRMDDLSKHIHLAHADVEQVHKSAKKITSRFERIELVDLEVDAEQNTDQPLLEE